MVSPLQTAVDFFKDFGLFDIVLPFLLIFTLVFAVLEKTKLLGTEGDDHKTPKKNLNAMVAFVIGLIVVATNKIVSVINKAIPNVILLLVIFVCFLMLVGIFWKSEEIDFSNKHKTFYMFFAVVSLIAIILIFLGSITLDDGRSWLEYAWDYIDDNWQGSVVSSFIILGVVIFAIAFITRSNRPQQHGGGG